MKRLVYSIITVLTLCYLPVQAQNIQYDLVCSGDGNSYEIFVSRDATAGVLFAGSSTITLVLPTGSSRTVSNTSESVSTYNAVTPIIDANGSGDDFYPFNTSGGASLSGVLVADTPVLWLTLTPSDGVDQDARLFINGTDPDDIGGVNASNVFSTLSPAGTVDEYNSNVNNNPINCGTLSSDDFALTQLNDIVLYPNPTRDIAQIRGVIDLEKIEIYTLTGQKVMEQESSKPEIDIRRLRAAVYMVRIYGSQGSKTIRLIKE